MFTIIFLLLIIPASIISTLLFYYLGTLSGENSIENRLVSSGLGVAMGLGISIGWPILLPGALAMAIMYFLLGFITKKINSSSSKINKILEIIKGKDE